MKKIIISGFITVLGVSTYISPAFADIYDLVTPVSITQDKPNKLTYIANASSDISISASGVTTVKSSVTGIASVTGTEITVRLQQLKNGSWVTIGTWYNTGGRSCSLSKTKSVTKGHSYRVSSIVKASKGSDSESKTVNSASESYD